MLVDLVQVTASDQVRLHGALEVPTDEIRAAQPNPKVDAWLCLHGTGSNFYAASTLAGITPKLLATGAAVLRANTRGHDIICTGPSAGGHALQGAAYERVDEAPLDIAAWIALLKERGYARIGLLGHSLGAIKAILALAHEEPANVAALAAISPPRLSYSHFVASAHGAGFQKVMDEAVERVNLGRGEELLFVQFPIPYCVSASGYVDRYGPDEKYNILRLLGRVQCPTLVVYGSTEVQSNVAFRGMPEAVEELGAGGKWLQTAVVAGADHIYTGCHDSLAAIVNKWVARLG